MASAPASFLARPFFLDPFSPSFSLSSAPGGGPGGTGGGSAGFLLGSLASTKVGHVGGVMGSFRAGVPHAFFAGAPAGSSRTVSAGLAAPSDASLPCFSLASFTLDALADPWASEAAAGPGDVLPSFGPSSGAAGFPPPWAGFDLTIADQGAFTGREGNTGALYTWFEGTMGCEVSFWGRMVRRDGYRAPEGFGENTGRLSLHGNFLVSMRRRARRGGARRDVWKLTFAAPASCEPLSSTFACVLAPVSTLSVALDMVFDALSVSLLSRVAYVTRNLVPVSPSRKPAARSPTRRERRTRAVRPYPDSARSRAPRSNAPY